MKEIKGEMRKSRVPLGVRIGAKLQWPGKTER